MAASGLLPGGRPRPIGEKHEVLDLLFISIVLNPHQQSSAGGFRRGFVWPAWRWWPQAVDIIRQPQCPEGQVDVDLGV